MPRAVDTHTQNKQLKVKKSSANNCGENKLSYRLIDKHILSEEEQSGSFGAAELFSMIFLV